MADNKDHLLYAIVPAAGVGSRMKAGLPKQYLQLLGKTILEHTVEKLLAHSSIEKVIVAVSNTDPYYPQLAIADNPDVIRVDGGDERADSVLSGLQHLSQLAPQSWVLVHDAARPCVCSDDISKLIEEVHASGKGGILAAPVRDTMKRAGATDCIESTVDRSNLWHALTPQMFAVAPLKKALTEAKQQGVLITDEASAMEWLGEKPILVSGKMDNLKITQPEDLALAEFYLRREREKQL